jgi:hypothetical protein
MNKSFLKIYGVLLVFLFQFTSCFDYDNNNKPLYYFFDEPVVVNQLGTYPFVRNESYMFYVPGLTGNTNVKEGNILWTSFVVDLDDNEYPSVLSTFNYTARRFNFEIVDSAKVIIPADIEEFESFLSDSYSEPVELSVLYKYVIDSLWFFGFKHKENSNQVRYAYELILNPEKGNNDFPTLYIRSKRVNAPAGCNARDQLQRNIFAFDTKEFVNYYRESISPTGQIRFNLKYKTGVNTNGADIYKDFTSNPIPWNFNEKKIK